MKYPRLCTRIRTNRTALGTDFRALRPTWSSRKCKSGMPSRRANRYGSRL